MFDKFFRNRAINAFLNRKENGILPDISKCPTMALLLNEAQYVRLKELETILNTLFALKKCSFFVISNDTQDKVLLGDDIYLITKGCYNLLGKFGRGMKSLLSLESYDMVVNLSGSNSELLTEEYVMTVLKTSFRISFGESYESLYDLVIDSKNADMIVKIEALHKYLLMLSGK